MSINTTTKLALGAVLAAATVAAQAQAYVSASAGTAKADLDCSGTISCDNKGSAYKLVGGYKFNPTVALEIGYTDFGKATQQILVGGSVVDGTFKASGPTVGVAFHMPFAPSWKGVARLGLQQVKTKLAASTPGFFASDSDTTSQLYGGLGVGYLVTPQVSIDAGWDFSKAKYSGDSATINMFSLGVTVGF